MDGLLNYHGIEDIRRVMDSALTQNSGHLTGTSSKLGKVGADTALIRAVLISQYPPKVKRPFIAMAPNFL